MTGFDGYVEEMPVPDLDDRALDALLRGSASGEPEIDWLVPFVEDLGVLAATPAPVVRPALATLMAEGFSIEKGDLPATAASNVPGPARQASGLPKWRKKLIVSELLAGIATKLAGLGMAAKAGLGLTVAAASVTTAGAANVLPDPVQHAVASTVESTTPFSFPDSADDQAGTNDDGEGIDGTGDDGTGDGGAKNRAGEDNPGKGHAEDHPGLGAIVSADARGESDGVKGVDGQVISELAKARNGGGDDGTEDGTEDDADDEADDEADDTAGNGVGANSGAKGHDRVAETPAGDHGHGPGH